MDILDRKTKIYLSISGVCAMILLIYAYFLSTSILKKSYKNQIETHYETTLLKLERFEKDKYNLLYTIVNDKNIKNIFQNKTNDILDNFLINLVKSNTLITQLRVLDLKGNEVIRINQKGSSTYFEKKENLQNKLHRDYFKNFLNLKQNELGISELNLNVENNKIERPFLPTLRFSMPIFKEHKKIAILIINYNMRNIINDTFSSSFFDIYFLDKEGYFIKHRLNKYNWSKYTSKLKKDNYFSSSEKKEIFVKSLNLFGDKYSLIYNLNNNLGIDSLFDYSIKIGIILFIAISFLITPLLYIVFRNFNQLKKLNQTLSQSQKEVELIFNNTSDSIILINDKGIIKKANSATEKNFGYKQEELLNKNVNILVPQPHHSHHDEYLNKHDGSMKRKIINQNRELYGLKKDGSLINISLTVTKVIISEKVYFIGTIQNLTEQEKSKKLFENVFNATTIGVALVLKDGSFWRLNRKFADIIGYTVEELTKLTFQDITYKEDLEKDLSLVYKILNKEIDHYSIIKRYVKKDKELVWVKLNVKGVFLDSNNEELDYFIATIDDITKQIQLQEKLSEAERVSQLGHWSWNIKTNFLFWSDNMLELFGKTKDSFNNCYEDFINTVIEEDKDLVNNKVKESLDNKAPFDITYRIKANNKIKYISAKGKIKYQGGIPIEFFGTCQDITSRKKLEDEKKQRDTLLMEQSKLASMGEMVGAIAHQWRQPLNSIGFIVQDMVSAYKHNELNEEYINEIKKEMMEQLHYMSDTIDEFRTFFKKDEPLKEFNLLNTILEVERLYKAQLTAHKLKLNIKVLNKSLNTISKEEKFLFNIKGQEGQLKQVIINLISNVKDIVESNKNLSSVQKEILIGFDLLENEFKIYFEDLVGGIPGSIMKRIFEPYFTTKDMGTGLGLYICKTICNKSLKGKIEYKKRKVKVDNTNYLGSTFIITLPRNLF